MEVQRRESNEIFTDIGTEDVDLNFVMIHLLSHFGDHIRRFGNIHIYSTKAWETSDKTMIKEGYQQSNKNDVSHQILQIYAKLDSFTIHEINIQADLQRRIGDELGDKQNTRQIGSLTRQLEPRGFTPNIETILQFNQTVKSSPELLIDYYGGKSSMS